MVWSDMARHPHDLLPSPCLLPSLPQVGHYACHALLQWLRAHLALHVGELQAARAAAGGGSAFAAAAGVRPGVGRAALMLKKDAALEGSQAQQKKLII